MLIGKTNMLPLAAGGMQRGVYGRAESPYNPEFLTAAYASGSSNGSGTLNRRGFGAASFRVERMASCQRTSIPRSVSAPSGTCVNDEVVENAVEGDAENGAEAPAPQEIK